MLITHSLTHSLTLESVECWFTILLLCCNILLTHSLTHHLLIYLLLPHSFTHHLLTHSPTHSMIHATHSTPHKTTHSFTHSLTPTNAVSSRGCTRLFIICVLQSALKYCRSLAVAPLFPFKSERVREWLKDARRTCEVNNGAVWEQFGGVKFDTTNPTT